MKSEENSGHNRGRQSGNFSSPNRRKPKESHVGTSPSYPEDGRSALCFAAQILSNHNPNSPLGDHTSLNEIRSKSGKP